MSERAFTDRREAGRALAAEVARRAWPDPVVLALPRGGVTVAAEIARALAAPLDLVFVRKIGVPVQPELAAAAVVDGATPEVVVNEDVLAMASIDRGYVDAQVEQELTEIARRRDRYLGDRERVEISGKTAIVVDDGIATGASARAALKALRRRDPRALILAVPVAPADTLATLRADVDEIICLATPDPFIAIGVQYRDFHQVPDEEVVAALAETAAARKPVER